MKSTKELTEKLKNNYCGKEYYGKIKWFIIDIKNKKIVEKFVSKETAKRLRKDLLKNYSSESKLILVSAWSQEYKDFIKSKSMTIKK